jgi:hypothetical protein
MIPPVFDEADLPERLRRLVAMEIDRILEDLELRRDFLLDTWSRHRDRGPFLDTVFSRWTTLSMTDLGLIEAEAMVACDTFYRELEDFRLYIRFTQDMPATLADRYDLALRHLAAYGALAVDRLGGAPERPEFTFDDEEADASLFDPVPRLEVVDGGEE